MALEAAGLGLAVVGILMQTFESTYKAYNLIVGMSKYNESYMAVLSEFQNQREFFLTWGEKNELWPQAEWHPSDPGPEQRLLERVGKRRYDRIASTLREVEKLLREAEMVNNKYGLKKVRMGRKVEWHLSKEDEFLRLVKRLRTFNSDLREFTSVEAPRVGRGGSAGMAGLLRQVDMETIDVAAVRKMRFAAHDFDMLLDDSTHFSSPNLGLLLKLQPNRFVLEEKEMALQKIPEWLELQMRSRPTSAKFMMTLIPQIFDESLDSDSGVDIPVDQKAEVKKDEKGTNNPARPVSRTASRTASPDPKRRKVPEVKLLFESLECRDSKRSSNPNLKHIAIGLERLSRPISQSHACQHCNDLSNHFSDMGLCLGGFRGVATQMNHFVYKIPNMPHPAERAVSLEDLMPGGKHESILKKVPIPQKRKRLVYLLALSFLQLYETPWFPVDITTNDIMFSVRLDGSLKPSIIQPFLRRRAETQFSRSTTKTRDMLNSADRNEPPSTKTTDFDDGAFYLGLLIFQILTWLPREERVTLVSEAKKTRNALRTRLPVYSATHNTHTAEVDPMAEFGIWMKKRGLLAALKSVVSSAKDMNAVRLCLVGGFGTEQQTSGMAGRRKLDVLDESDKVKAMEEDFWTRVVMVMDPEK